MTQYDDLVQRIRSCTLCSLSDKRTNAVPGEGAIDSDIMFIGEGPGFHEDRLGRPFVGPAGKLLDELLESIGLQRGDVYIANMIKCRPPDNRDPLPDEIASCKPYLDEQISLISPKVIVLLGRYSFARFFPGEAISKARGRPRTLGGLTLYPIYHPAAALHNPGLRPILEQDFQKLSSLVASEPPPVPEPAELELEPEQLSLL